MRLRQLNHWAEVKSVSLRTAICATGKELFFVTRAIDLSIKNVLCTDVTSRMKAHLHNSKFGGKVTIKCMITQSLETYTAT